MPQNKKLPVLKLLISPIIIGTAYGAFCYYREQYYHDMHKQNHSVRYIQQLYKILLNSTNILELKRVYNLIYKHVDKFVIDPSSREEKIVDEKAEREVESRISLSSYNKLAKYYKVNQFNFRDEKVNGNFMLGVWWDLNQVKVYSVKIREIQPIVKIVEKSIKARHKKCREFAQVASGNLEKGYLDEYYECMGATQGYAALLERQIDIVKKIEKYQLK